MVYGELRAAIERTERHRLDEVASALWRAYGAGGLTDAEAEALSARLDARRTMGRTGAAPLPGPIAPMDPPADPSAPRRSGSRPRSPESLARRRRWAAAGYLPPALAARFTAGETAALAVIAREVGVRGRCALALGAIAALAGVHISTVRRAVRAAQAAGLLGVEERRLSRWRSDTNLVTITSREWVAWLRLRLPRMSGGALQTGKGANIGDSGDNQARPRMAGSRGPAQPARRVERGSRVAVA